MSNAEGAAPEVKKMSKKDNSRLEQARAYTRLFNFVHEHNPALIKQFIEQDEMYQKMRQGPAISPKPRRKGTPAPSPRPRKKGQIRRY